MHSCDWFYTISLPEALFARHSLGSVMGKTDYVGRYRLNKDVEKRELMKNIAIIPARSGSKGLKDKNIKMLGGKPLLAYSVEAAIKSGIFDCVHVSTDSEYYADIGRKYGADIPFLRSKEMSNDTAKSWDMVLDTLQKYEKIGERFDMVTLLQPTSPLRDAEDIGKVFEEYQEKKAQAVVSVCEMEHSPLWSNTLPENLSMDHFMQVQSNQPRQSLKQYYRINGAIYMVNIPFLKEDMNIYRQGCFAYIMDVKKSIDIDTQIDFEIADVWISKIGGNK